MGETKAVTWPALAGVRWKSAGTGAAAPKTSLGGMSWWCENLAVGETSTAT